MFSSGILEDKGYDQKGILKRKFHFLRKAQKAAVEKPQKPKENQHSTEEMRLVVVYLLLMVATTVQGNELNGQAEQDQRTDERVRKRAVPDSPKVQKVEAKLDEEIKRIGGEMGNLKAEVDRTATRVVSLGRRVEESRMVVDEPSSVIDPANLTWMNSLRERQVANETFLNQKGALERTINQYNRFISTWHDFELQVPDVQKELTSLKSRIKELNLQRNDKGEGDENRKKELEEANEAFSKLTEVQRVRESFDKATADLKKKVVKERYDRNKLDSAIMRTLTSSEEYAELSKKLADSKKKAEVAKKMLDEAKATLASLSGKKKNLQKGLDIEKQMSPETENTEGLQKELELDKQMSPEVDYTKEAIPMAVVGKKDDMLGEYDYGQEDSHEREREVAVDSTEHRKNLEETELEIKFVESPLFWVLLGLAGAVVFLGLVGSSLYCVGCKEKRVKTERSDGKSVIEIDSEMTAGSQKDPSSTVSHQTESDHSTTTWD